LRQPASIEVVPLLRNSEHTPANASNAICFDELKLKPAKRPKMNSMPAPASAGSMSAPPAISRNAAAQLSALSLPVPMK
jgi:hypothetical protein